MRDSLRSSTLAKICASVQWSWPNKHIVGTLGEAANRRGRRPLQISKGGQLSQVNAEQRNAHVRGIIYRWTMLAKGKKREGAKLPNAKWQAVESHAVARMT